jgi:hypothetical protein
MYLLAVTREAAWVARGKRTPRLRALLRAVAGVGPDVGLHVGLLEGLVITVREGACVHSDEDSKPVRGHLV